MKFIFFKVISNVPPFPPALLVFNKGSLKLLYHGITNIQFPLNFINICSFNSLYSKMSTFVLISLFLNSCEEWFEGICNIYFGFMLTMSCCLFNINTFLPFCQSVAIQFASLNTVHFSHRMWLCTFQQTCHPKRF